MKNRIKKILLLGMTAMFTAGAAGTAVSSCPVGQIRQKIPGKTAKMQKKIPEKTVKK